MAREYTCAACGIKFTSEREEGAAIEEFRANFPDLELERDCVVCGDCYEKFWKWMEQAHPKVERKV